jgi:glycosyltransferase involved in cell wall biosynthesis
MRAARTPGGGGMRRITGPRILITTDAVGGVWVYSSTLAATLARRGAQIHLVTLGPSPRLHQLASLRGLSNVRVECTDLALEWMDPGGADFERACDCLVRIARRIAPDLVHLNGYREALADWRAPIVLAAHSCVWSWWQACHGGQPAEALWHVYRANVAAGLAAADLWLAPTAAFRDRIHTLYAPAHRGQVIHNGTDVNGSRRPKESFVLAAGRLWDEAKNARAVAAAAGVIGWPVRLVGFERDSNQANVQWLGELPRDDLVSLMARAAIFAAPARYEPFGLCVLEAAACGCALVLADIASFRELWDGAALFVDPSDTRELVSALRRVSGNAALRTRLQEAARLRAQRYSAAAMADAYCRAYAEVLASPPRIAPGWRATMVEGRA